LLFVSSLSFYRCGNRPNRKFIANYEQKLTPELWSRIFPAHQNRAEGISMPVNILNHRTRIGEQDSVLP
jgi:hypothetical protein